MNRGIDSGPGERETTRSQLFKDALFQQLARVAAAFSSPKRIEIVDVLAQGQRNVEALARETGLSVANASRHLQTLKACHLVETRREGRQVLYRLAHPLVLEGYRTLRVLARDRLAEVDRLVAGYFRDPKGFEPVSREELLARVGSGEVVVLDVRPRQEFEAGHIPGALPIPIAELERRVAEIPDGKDIVAYCRGPYCVLAAEAAELLRRHGRKAWRLDEGFPEWRDQGLPVEGATEVPAPRPRAQVEVST